jgi:hypothetical protein
MIYGMVAKYNDFDGEYENNVNVDEDLMQEEPTIENIGRLVTNQPVKNYSNFKLGMKSHSKERKQFKTQIMKSRLRRYNDANTHDIEEVYDVNSFINPRKIITMDIRKEKPYLLSPTQWLYIRTSMLD